jgi:type II secretory pathway component GspD/PulD (secretin)
LLANPNILTVNHKRAEIRRVEEFPYREFGVDPSGRSITSTQFLDLGIILGVTPHVLRDPQGQEYIKLELEPEVSIAVGQADGVPIRSVRSSKSEANVRDGQTLVIGGIYKNDRANIKHPVPGLGSLPVIGTLFRRTENRDVETELMVFVTPRIHDTPESISVREMIAVGDDGTAVDAVAFMNEVEQRRETRRR